jgi:predicted acetyltransferase
MESVADVEVADAALEERATILNLMQLYMHDFSEFAEIGTLHGEAASDGRFAHHPLDVCWREDGWFPLIIRADRHLAGFALVSPWSALDRPLDQSVAEFFVLRKYRRAQVGLRAAKRIFERFPGRWEVPVAFYNQPALAFWRKTVPASIGREAEEFAGDGERWNGPVLCFDTGRRPPRQP